MVIKDFADSFVTGSWKERREQRSQSGSPVIEHSVVIAICENSTASELEKIGIFKFYGGKIWTVIFRGLLKL